MAYLGVQPLKGQNRTIDNISASFNGSNVTFNLTSGGFSLTPATAYQLFISVGGVLQSPSVDFTVSGNQITFTTAPAAGLSFWGLYQGDAIDSVSVSDGSITTAKLATGLTVTLGAGAVGTPSLTFAGDTNTGIYSPAADTIAFVEGGVEALRIDSSARVGIGTSSPLALLDIRGNVYMTGNGTSRQTTAVVNTGGSFETGVESSAGAAVFTGSTAYASVIGSQNSTPLQFGTNGAIRATLDSSGRLGIGTSAPGSVLAAKGPIASTSNWGNLGITSEFPINASGRIYTGLLLQDSGTSGSAGVGFEYDGTGYKLHLATAASTSSGLSTRLTIDRSGNVGIGSTSDPGGMGARLWIDSTTDSYFTVNTTGSGSVSGINFRNSNANGEARFVNNTGGPLTFYRSVGNEAARIDSSGRLLVGTSSTSVNNRLIVQSNTDSSTGPATFLLAKGDNAPASSATLGLLRFGGSTHVQSAEIYAFRDGGTWTAGSSLPTALAFSTTADGASSPTERMRISSSGVLTHTGGTSTTGGLVAEIKGSGTGLGFLVYEGNNNGAANAANSTVKVGQTTATARSISAAGTINASGADYAEYMIKGGDFTIAKGDICGVTSTGLLTNEYSTAISFVVKSTSPSYVGGDNWGIGFDDDPEGLEAVRQTVDRIAFAGQVPVNVMGATPGQYIVPIEAADSGIEGIAKDEADLTLAEYMRAVGKVIAIEDDGRARIIVKVA